LSEPSAEFDQLRAGAAHDHEMLLAWLDDLSMRLREADPSFRSWATALNEVAMVVDRLEEHEAMEAQSVQLFVAKLEVQSSTDV
jgi:hypothetical protein